MAGTIEGAWCGEWGREEGVGRGMERGVVTEGWTVREGEETGAAAAAPAPAALRREMAGMAGTEVGANSAALRQGGLTTARSPRPRGALGASAALSDYRYVPCENNGQLTDGQVSLIGYVTNRQGLKFVLKAMGHNAK